MQVWQNFGYRVVPPVAGSAVSASPNVGSLSITGYAPTVAANGSASAITPATLSVGLGGVNRISGVAPLAVHFDASATTAATLTSYPYHEIEYTWDFGDTGAGSWLYGANTNFSLTSLKNTDIGPVACHVFETAGTYTVTLGTRYDSTTGTPSTVVITVDDPEVVFASTTVCLSPNTDHTGSPSGATLVNNVSNVQSEIATQIAAGKRRILLKRGATWNISAPIDLNVNGPGHLGAYGSGAKPKITTTVDSSVVRLSSYSATGLSDWRVWDLELDGGGFVGASVGTYFNGGINNVLIGKVKVQHAKYGALSSTGNINPSVGTIWDGQCYYECDIQNSAGNYPTDSGGNGMLVAAQRLAIIGCNIVPNGGGEHGIRSGYSDRAVFSHLTIKDVVATKAHLSIRSPLLDGEALGIFDQVDYSGIVYTEKVYSADNYMAQTDGSLVSYGAGPVNPNNGIGRVRNVIMERNYLINGEITHLCSQTTTRNNIFTRAGGRVFATEHMAFQPDPVDVWCYNNSVYGTSTAEIQYINSTGGSMTGSTFTVKNNLVYSPGTTDTSYSSLFWNPVGITITESNNSTEAQYITTSPNFTTTPPTQPSHWKPTSGYALTGGTSVPVWSDFFGVTVTGSTRVMGAVKN